MLFIIIFVKVIVMSCFCENLFLVIVGRNQPMSCYAQSFSIASVPMWEHFLHWFLQHLVVSQPGTNQAQTLLRFRDQMRHGRISENTQSN